MKPSVFCGFLYFFYLDESKAGERWPHYHWLYFNFLNAFSDVYDKVA